MGDKVAPGKDGLTSAQVSNQVNALGTLAKIYGVTDPRVRVELEGELVGVLRSLRGKVGEEALRQVTQAPSNPHSVGSG